MPGLLFRREVLGDGFDEGISVHFGDFVILMRIAERWDVGLIKESLLRIRRHETQASQAMPRAETLALRAKQLRAYCDEYEVRWPDERAFVDDLRRGIEVTHRLSLLGYWLVSDTTNDAEACLHELLGGTSLARTVGTTLVRMDWVRRQVKNSRSAISALSRLAGGLGL
jgi:hypothetical protein